MAWIARHRITWIIIILVLVQRSPTLLDSMYLVDEGYSGAIATELLYGGTIYQTAVDTRAPFTYYLYYGVFLIAGQNNLLAVHIVAILFVIVTAWGIRRIGALVAGTQAGDWAAVGYVIFSHTYLPRDTLAANVEIFTLLPSSLSMLCFLIGERQHRPTWLFISGMLCGISIFFRQPCIVNIGVIGGYLIYKWWMTRTPGLRQVIGAGFWVMAGMTTVIGGTMLYFQSQGNWQDMIEWTWLIAMRYVNSETTVAYTLKRLLLVHGTFILAGGLLWYFGIKQFVTTVREHLRGSSDAVAPIMIVLWFAATYMTLFTGWRFPGHYHLMVLPPLAILGGIAFSRFLNRLTQRNPSEIHRIRRILVSVTVAPALGFLLMAFIIREDTLAFKPITDYITGHTQPEDRIFVWGSAPYIYSFSGRRMATRFASCSHLVGMYASRPHKDIDASKWIVPGSWVMLDSDLIANPPELIIDMSPISSNWDLHPMSRYPILQTHLETYRLEEKIQGVYIYRRIAS